MDSCRDLPYITTVPAKPGIRWVIVLPLVFAALISVSIYNKSLVTGSVPTNSSLFVL